MFSALWSLATSGEGQCWSCGMGGRKQETETEFAFLSPRIASHSYSYVPMKPSAQNGFLSAESTRECTDPSEPPEAHDNCAALSRYSSTVSLQPDAPATLDGYYDRNSFDCDSDAGSAVSRAIRRDFSDEAYALHLRQCQRKLDSKLKKDKGLSGGRSSSQMAGRSSSSMAVSPIRKQKFDAPMAEHQGDVDSDAENGESETETESERINRCYEEKGVASKIRHLRANVALESPGRQQVRASLNPDTTAKINAFARSEADIRTAMLRAQSPRDGHGCFRERLHRFHEGLKEEKVNDQQVMDGYRGIMQEKFSRIGAHPADIRGFTSTSDAAETVREAVSQYHRHSMHLNRYYPEPNQHFDGIDMKQTMELDKSVRVLEYRPQADVSLDVVSI